MPELKRIWDNYHVIGDVQKSDKIKIVVAAAIRDGVKYINVREFYMRQRDDTWMPGRDGITIPLIVPILEGTELIKPYEGLSNLFLLATLELKDMPLADEEHAIYVMPKLPKTAKPLPPARKLPKLEYKSVTEPKQIAPLKSAYIRSVLREGDK